jgi:hypothetical protein
MRLSCLQALGVFLIAMCGPARAEFYWHEPAFSDVSMRGPERAHGALIYSHGRGTVVAGRIVPGESHYAPTAPYVRFLLEAGWDAFKLNRKYVADREPDSARAIEAEIGRLRALGYRRIVLAGQSYGAWLSVLVATRDSNIHAVIATAPGTGFGNSSIDRVTLGAQKLLDFVDDMRSTRVAFFFFAGDDLEATGRGEQVARRLSARQQYHWVVDRPGDLWGHNAARTGLFTRRYSECLARLIAPDPPPDLHFACDTTRGLAAGSDIPMAANAGLVVASPGAPPALAPFIGRWLGEEESGVIRRLAVTGIVDETRLRADYGAAGPLFSAQKPSVIRAMVGTIEAGELVFRDKVMERRFRAIPDGTLQGDWRRIDGKPGGGQITYRRAP